MPQLLRDGTPTAPNDKGIGMPVPLTPSMSRCRHGTAATSRAERPHETVTPDPLALLDDL